MAAFPYRPGQRVAGLKHVEGIGPCLINGTVKRVESRTDGTGYVDIYVLLDGYDEEKRYIATSSGACDYLEAEPVGRDV